MQIHNGRYRFDSKNKRCFWITLFSFLLTFSSLTTEASGEPDRFESNDTPKNANLIIIQDVYEIEKISPSESLFRNFHSRDDRDWVTFYAQEDRSYTIKVEAVGNNDDIVPDYTLYFLSGTRLIKVCETIEGGFNEDPRCPIKYNRFTSLTTGFYFMELQNSHSKATGNSTGYAVRIGGRSGDHVIGIVRDANTEKPIAGATITVEGYKILPTRSQGAPREGLYAQPLPSWGRLILVATHDGYVTSRTGVTETSEQVDIYLIPEEPDLSEPNDTAKDANLVIVGSGETDPVRNFDSKTDIDWIVFFAQEDESYTINVEAALKNTDLLPDYTLYFLNGNQLEQVCGPISNGIGDEVGCPISGNQFTPLKPGFYFIRLVNSNPDFTGNETSYLCFISGPTVAITGIVRDINTGCPVIGATITIEGTNFAPTQSRGAPVEGLYSQPIPPASSLTLVANHDDYLESRINLTSPFGRMDIDMTPRVLPIYATGYRVANEIWIRAVIETEDQGSIEGAWQLKGQDTTARGDRVSWGFFHASPSDVPWGSRNNPDLFVKIWIDAGGPIYVNYFHVSVPDIHVYTDFQLDGCVDRQSTATLANRFVEHRLVNGVTGETVQSEDGRSPTGHFAAGSPQGAQLPSNLRIGSIINIENGYPIEGAWRLGGDATTARGDRVVWGHFYADPSDVSWGSANNPDLFVKIWFDVGGAIFVDFFHVSVPDIEVFSNLSSSPGYADRGVTKLNNRFVEYRY